MIDKITCLAYDKRKDMWPALQEQVKLIFNKDLELFIGGDGHDSELVYDHIDTTNLPTHFLYTANKGHYNAFLCHRKMAQRAIDENVNNVLFLEDDSYFIKDRIKILQTDYAKYFIENGEWDICYLGWWQKKTHEGGEDRDDLEEFYKNFGSWNFSPIQRPPIVAHDICGLHGLLINRHFLSFIANAPIGPIDSLLHRNFDKINAWFLWPKLIHVHSTFSYCEGSYTERKKL
jgi:hypothetical protein